MSDLGYATVDVIPTIKTAPSTLARQLDGTLTPAAAASGGKFGTTAGTSAATKFKQRFTSLLRTGIIVGGAFAAFEGVKLIGDMIGQASDLNETLNLTRVIFDENSDAVLKWSRDSDTAFGLSRNAALQSAGQFGNMFDQLGFGADQALKMSERTVKLAADLGSFRNLGTEDVLERIGAGFRGEYDSLQLLVPTITAAAVQQRALRDTGKESADQLNAQEKAAATLAIIFDKTKKAQGDFARTSGGLANSQKILGAELDNVQAKIGKALLPIAKDLVHFLSDEGVPALEDFSGWFTAEGLPAIEDGAHWIGEFGTELKPIVDNALPVLVSVGHDAAGMLLGLVGGLKGAAGLFASLPPDVQKLAFEVGIAAIAYGRLNQAVATSTLINWSKGLADAETRTLRLQSALRTISGTAGILAFAQGVGEADAATSTFETTVGGALAGFGVGGPWGAAIGGGVGLLTGLGKAFVFSGDSADGANPQIASYIDTLSGLTGAATKATRQLAAQTLEEAGLLKDAQRFGIKGGDLVDAIIGPPDKLAAVQGKLSSALNASQRNAHAAQAAMDAYSASIERDGIVTEAESARQHELSLRVLQTHGHVLLQKEAIDRLTSSLTANRDKLKDDAAEQRRVAEAVTGNRLELDRYRKLLGDIPPEARTQVKAFGTDVAKADLKSINEQFKGFSDKDFAAFVKVFGLDDANRELQAANTWLDTIDGKKSYSYVINTVTDRHLVQAPGQAFGGPISGPGGPRDDRAGLFRLSDGEYVEPSDVVAYYGMPFFDALRAKAIPKAEGGGVATGSSHTPSGSLEQLVRALIGEVQMMRRGLPVQVTNPDALDGRSRAVARDEIGADQAFRVSHGRQWAGVS